MREYQLNVGNDHEGILNHMNIIFFIVVGISFEAVICKNSTDETVGRGIGNHPMSYYWRFQSLYGIYGILINTLGWNKLHIKS